MVDLINIPSGTINFSRNKKFKSSCAFSISIARFLSLSEVYRSLIISIFDLHGSSAGAKEGTISFEIHAFFISNRKVEAADTQKRIDALLQESESRELGKEQFEHEIQQLR